jgi:hypothetical protein
MVVGLYKVRVERGDSNRCAADLWVNERGIY